MTSDNNRALDDQRFHCSSPRRLPSVGRAMSNSVLLPSSLSYDDSTMQNLRNSNARRTGDIIAGQGCRDLAAGALHGSRGDVTAPQRSASAVARFAPARTCRVLGHSSRYAWGATPAAAPAKLDHVLMNDGRAYLGRYGFANDARAPGPFD